MRKFSTAVAVAAVAAAAAFPAGASADHCTAEGPGHSYFGTDHVQETDHAEGTTHKGFSSCNPSENNPSERSSGGKSQS